MTTRTNPIPDGIHSITPYLTVKGASEAIDFYKKAFGAKELMRVPWPDGKLIMHAQIKIGDSPLFITDEFPDMNWAGSELSGRSPVTIHLYVDDVDKTFKAALAAGAKETMPVADMFWGDRYGRLVDPFGHQWSLATHIEDLSPDEIGKRAQTACQQG
jgi:PhnB protein